MKSKFALILIFSFLLFYSCDKWGNDYKSEGIIVGADLTMCGCCGGWIINIDSLTYRFDAVPTDSKINLEKETFPLKVKLDWQLINNGCPLNRITVTRIKKI
jgi:hypothetical protein